MSKENVTISLTRHTLENLRALAGRRATSISALLAEQIEILVEREDAYERARRRRSLDKMVRPERIELPTSWFVAKHSIQLSYGRILAELCLRIITEQNRFAQPRSSNTLADKNL